ncbi:MAG: replication-relaxation family protein [Deltaproteobacteria bacterium]|nr:replication-relaxation family protein [Deltaproteobacteria bacterium]
MRQLAARLGKEATELEATFAMLVGDGALRELRPSTFAVRDHAPAYALTPAGLALVDVDRERLRPRTTRTLRSAFSLAHELLVNEFGLALEALDARGDLRLLSWQTAREKIGDVVHLAEKGHAVRVPLVADALAIVEHHGRRMGLLLETDMGTVSTKTMRLKYAGYHAWWADGGPVRRFGLAATRVITVAPRPQRLMRLRDLAIGAVDKRGSGLLWFLPHDAVDVAAPERLLDATAFVAKAGEDHPRALFRP